MARPLRLVAALAALGLLALLVLPRLDVRLDLSFFVPDDPRQEDLLLIDRLRDTAGGLVLVGISDAPPEVLASASQDMVRSLRDSGLFVSVANGYSLALDRGELEPLLAARYLLSSFSPDDFAAASLRSALQERLAELASSRGWLLRDLAFRDPTGSLGRIAARWRTQGPGVQHEVWMNDAATRALIVARSLATSTDLAAQADVSAAVDLAASPARAQGMKVEATGPGLLAYETSRIIRGEMITLSVIGSLLVAGLVLLAFRAPTMLLLLGLPITAAVIAGAGTVQLLFGHVHGVALTFGATLVGVAIDYPLHLAVHLRPDERPAATMRRLARPLLLSALTTIGGFVAIAMSDFPGLAQLGTLSATGMAVAYLVSRWVLPWLMPPAAAAGAVDRRWRDRAAWLRKLPALRLPALGLLAGMIVAAVLRPGPLWEEDLANLGALSQEARQRDHGLRADLQAADVRFMLVVRGADVEHVLEGQETLLPALAAAVTTGALGGYDMAAELLPSARMQQERQDELPAADELKRNLAEALEGMRLKPDALSGFVEDVSDQKMRRPLTLEDLPAGPLRWRLEPLLRHERDGVSGLVLLKGPVDAGALARLAVDAGNGVHFLDLRQAASRLVIGYRDAVLTWLAVGAVVGLAVLLLGLRQWRLVAGVALPAFLAIAATVSALVVAGIPLTLFHLLALLLVAGVGVDYALFFVGYSREAGNGGRKLRSIVLCNASTAAVFATLAFSRMPVLNGIGLTVAIGVVTALLMTLVFVEADGSGKE